MEAIRNPRPVAPTPRTPWARAGATTLKFMENVETSPTRTTASSTTGVAWTYRRPSARLSATPRTLVGRASRAVGRRSASRIMSSPTITATKLMPLRKKQAVTPRTPIRIPPMAGPTIRAALNIAEFRPIAFVTSSRPTISTTNAWRVGMSTALTSPSSAASTRMCQTWVTFANVSAARARARIIDATCVPMIVFRFGRTSAITPPNRPRIRTGRNWTAARNPSQIGSWVSSRISHAWASDCIQVPISEMSWPNQKSRKLRWRRAPRQRSAPCPGSALMRADRVSRGRSG